jgi:putative transposase
MKRSRFSDEQIIGILKEQEASAVTADVCRRHGISEATFYKWKATLNALVRTSAVYDLVGPVLEVRTDGTVHRV